MFSQKNYKIKKSHNIVIHSRETTGKSYSTHKSESTTVPRNIGIEFVQNGTQPFYLLIKRSMWGAAYVSIANGSCLLYSMYNSYGMRSLAMIQITPRELRRAYVTEACISIFSPGITLAYISPRQQSAEYRRIGVNTAEDTHGIWLKLYSQIIISYTCIQNAYQTHMHFVCMCSTAKNNWPSSINFHNTSAYGQI